MLSGLLVVGSAVFAHDSYPIAPPGMKIPMIIEVGGIDDFLIIPNGATEGGVSIYHDPAPVSSNPSVATAAPAFEWLLFAGAYYENFEKPFENLESKEVVGWYISGQNEGTTDITFHWRYPPHDKPPNFPAHGDFVVQVTVIKAPDLHWANTQAIKSNDPVDTRSGELFATESVDLNLGGPLAVSFVRNYGSALAADGQLTSTLGTNRSHNFDAKLVTDGTSTSDVVTSRGRVVHFRRANDPAFGFATGWFLVGRRDIPYQLVEKAGVFRFLDPASQIVHVFDGATGRLTSIEDERGNVLTLTYSGGLLDNVTDNLGRTLHFGYMSGNLTDVNDGTRHVTFTYDANGNLKTATDANLHTTTYSYDANNLLTGIMRPVGNPPISQTYDGSGRVAAQTEHPGVDQMSTLTYDTNAHTTTITEADVAQSTRIHGYRGSGELSSFTDEAGNTVMIGADDTGRRSTVTDRLGRTTTMVYHALSGKPASITAADGVTTSFEYKARVIPNVADAGQRLTCYDLAKVTYADGTSRSFSYDAMGNLETALDELGKKTTFTYNNRGQVQTVTNATGGVVTYEYEEAAAVKGNLKSSTDNDPTTGKTTYTFDNFSRLTRITHPDTKEIVIEYDDGDRITSITDERMKKVTFTYDDNDNLTDIKDPASQTTHLGYDLLDRVKQVTDRLGKMSSQTFDARNLLATEKDENSNVTTIDYDKRQRVKTVTEPGGAHTDFGYNDEGELTSVTDPNSHTTTYLRNKLGRVIAATDPLGHSGELQRDALQRITKVIDLIGRQTALTYDQRGQLVGASRDGTGAATYTRDTNGNLTKIKDPNHGAWNFAYTPTGRLKSSKDPLEKTSGFHYDSRGRLATVDLPEGGSATIERDDAGNLIGWLFPDATHLQYSYDDDGRLITANGVVLTRDFEGQITKSTQGGIDFSASYDDAGRLTSVGYANGTVTVTYAYDVNDRLMSASDNLSHANVGFAYDPAGRLTTITRQVNGAMAPANNVTTFTYDNADRLTRIQDGTMLDLQYTLNADGDIVATIFASAPLMPSVAAAAAQFKYDAAGQVKGAGFTYDARGRLTAMPAIGSGSVHTFGWDGASRLTSMDAMLAIFTYDGFGDIATKALTFVNPSAETRFYYHHAIGLHPLVAERSVSPFSPDYTRFYVWTPGGTLLYAIDGTSHAPSFYHFDRVGSTLALTDGSGNVTDAYSYTPYGEMLGHNPGTSTQPFTFVGAFGVRAEGAFYQMRARYYDPLTARFLTRDPGGASLADVRTLDPYLYALGNPTRYVDATGAGPQEASNSLFPENNAKYDYENLPHPFVGFIVGGSKKTSILGATSGELSNNGFPTSSDGQVDAPGFQPNIGGIEFHIFAAASFGLDLQFLPNPELNGFRAFDFDENSLALDVGQINFVKPAVMPGEFGGTLDLSFGSTLSGPGSDGLATGQPGQPAVSDHASEFTNVAIAQTGFYFPSSALRGGGAFGVGIFDSFNQALQKFGAKLTKIVQSKHPGKTIAKMNKDAAQEALKKKNIADNKKAFGGDKNTKEEDKLGGGR